MSYSIYQATEFVKMRTESNQQRTAQSWQKKWILEGIEQLLLFWIPMLLSLDHNYRNDLSFNALTAKTDRS